MLCFFPLIIQLKHKPTCFFIQVYTLYWIHKRIIFVYHVRTIFWHKIWRGLVLYLLHRLKRFDLEERDKTFAFCFLARQTNIRLRLQNFLCEPMKVAQISGVQFTSCCRCIEIYSFLSKHPLRKTCSSSDLCIFCLLSSTKSVPMYLVTCWEYKQSHIFISPCRNDPSQLQNCKTKRFFTVLELCL